MVAGWSSSVARRAHNPAVAGSNPVPATDNPVSKETGFCFVYYVQHAHAPQEFIPILCSLLGYALQPAFPFEIGTA